MSKLKIEHGASKVNFVLLKTNIEDSISQDIDLMAAWSENDRKYIVNELLRFALMQDEEFQRHKANRSTSSTKPAVSVKPSPAPGKSSNDAGLKSESSSINNVEKGASS